MIKKRLLLISASLLFIMMSGCTPETPSPTTGGNNTATTTTTTTTVYARILDTRYVENRDSDGLAIRSWNYDSTGKVGEYSEYFYDASKRNNLTKSYSSEATTDPAYLGKYEYNFDGATKNITESKFTDKSGVIIQSYTATYNSQSKYLTYISKDTSGDIIENRVATYDVSGINCVTETYYSDEAKTKILEQYTRTYNSNGRCTDETKKMTIPVDSNDPSSDAMDYKTYESTLSYKYTWSPNSLCETYSLQQSFDETGELMDFTQHLFDTDGKTILKSFFATGKLQSYRTYSYDDNKFMTDESYYDKSDKIVNQFTYRLYKEGAVEYSNYYEKATYSYKLVTSASRGLSSSKKATDERLKAPPVNIVY